jgi:hypothetical protein
MTWSIALLLLNLNDLFLESSTVASVEMQE